jgi:hypothetical protein
MYCHGKGVRLKRYGRFWKKFLREVRFINNEYPKGAVSIYSEAALFFVFLGYTAAGIKPINLLAVIRVIRGLKKVLKTANGHEWPLIG